MADGEPRQLPDWMKRPADAPFWYPTLPGFLCVSLVSLFALVVAALLLKPMPLSEAAGTLLVALVTFLVAKLGTIVDFFFGNSNASATKDKTISDAMAAGSTGTGAGTNGKPPVVTGPVNVAGDMNVDGHTAEPAPADIDAAREKLKAAHAESPAALEAAWAVLSPAMQAALQVDYRALQADVAPKTQVP